VVGVEGIWFFALYTKRWAHDEDRLLPRETPQGTLIPFSMAAGSRSDVSTKYLRLIFVVTPASTRLSGT
jgi:hypothetical protein